MEKAKEMRFSRGIRLAVGCMLQIVAGEFAFEPIGTEYLNELDPFGKKGAERPKWRDFAFFSEITATPSRLAATDENRRDLLQRLVRFFHGDAIVAVVTLERMDDGGADTDWKVCTIRYALRANGRPSETDQWVVLNLAAVPIFLENA